MTKPPDRVKPASKQAIRDHGRRVGETVKRLTLHTDTFPINTEAGQQMDRRIIIEEANAAMASLLAIVSILAEGD